eukprot:TRINITY_DN2018_c0_g1_i1.p1 TRINITY_DN2018_c0_g1~~TRINITY_DN2018_c0_g1_i1.p1  ORF type:complete len:1271 (-),score=433.53 TRINITY_DN2018_c0_g1_i1:413-4225(-)
MSSKRAKSPNKTKKSKKKSEVVLVGSGSSKKLSIDEVWQLARGKQLEFDDEHPMTEEEVRAFVEAHVLNQPPSSAPGLASAGGSGTSGSADDSLEGTQRTLADSDNESAESYDEADGSAPTTTRAAASTTPKSRTAAGAAPVVSQPAAAHSSAAVTLAAAADGSRPAESSVASSAHVSSSDRQRNNDLAVPSASGVKEMQKSDTLVYEPKSRPQTTESRESRQSFANGTASSAKAPSATAAARSHPSNSPPRASVPAAAAHAAAAAHSSASSTPTSISADSPRSGQPHGHGHLTGSGHTAVSNGGHTSRTTAASGHAAAPGHPATSHASAGPRLTSVPVVSATPAGAPAGSTHTAASSPRKDGASPRTAGGTSPRQPASASPRRHSIPGPVTTTKPHAKAGAPSAAPSPAAPASAWASNTVIATGKAQPLDLPSKRRGSSDLRADQGGSAPGDNGPARQSSRPSLMNSSPRLEVSAPIETISLGSSASEPDAQGPRVPALATNQSPANAAAALYDDFPKEMIPSDAVMRATAERPRVPHRLSARSLSAHSEAPARSDNSRDDEIEALYAEQDTLRRELERAKAQISKYAVDITTMSWQLQVYKNRFMASKVQPPSGEVTLVFTDVKCSTELWELDPKAMCSALSLHNELLRKLMEQYYGYEIKTEGDAFFVAFASVENALRWSLEVQQQLLKLDWPESLFAHRFAAEERDSSGDVLYRGLRLRIGIHTGAPTCAKDPVTHRMDYLGPMVNRAARIASMAHGGQTVLSSAVWSQISDDKLKHRVGDPVFKTLGKFSLRGLEGDELIIQVTPKALSEREFPAIDSKPSNVISLESQIDALKKENEALIRRMEELEKGMAAVEANAQRVSENMHTMTSSASGEFITEATAYAEIKKIKKHQEFLTAKLLHMRVNNESLMKQIGMLTKQMGMFANENIKAQEMSAGYEAELIQLRISNTKLMAKIENYKKDLVVKIHELNELRGIGTAPPTASAGGSATRDVSPLASPHSPPSTASSDGSICSHEREAEDVERMMEEVLNRHQVKISAERVISTQHLLGDTKAKVKLINGTLSVQTPFGGYESFDNWVTRFKQHGQDDRVTQQTSPALSTLSAPAQPTRGHTSSGSRDDHHNAHPPTLNGNAKGASATDLNKVVPQFGPQGHIAVTSSGGHAAPAEPSHAPHQQQQKVLIGSTVSNKPIPYYRPPEGIQGASIVKQHHHGVKPKSAVHGKHPEIDKPPVPSLKTAPLIINNVPLSIGGDIGTERRYQNLPPLDH